MDKPESPTWGKMYVTRIDAAVIVALILAIIMFLWFRVARLEERDRQRAQEYQQLQFGVQKITDDLELLTKEIVFAKKEQP